MSLIPMLLKEMDQEAQTTRKMLERVPADKFDWKPHPKSMTLERLATHVAELPGWVAMAVTTDELDMANNPYKRKTVYTNAELMEFFESTYTYGRQHLIDTTDEILAEDWTFREGEIIHGVSSKAEVIRLAYNQVVHHRAQLGVFLRLLDIPIPGSYGPSADEHF